MNFISLLVYLYLLFKPFYFFESGGLQVADFFLVFAFLIFIILTKNNKRLFENSFNDNSALFLFIICTMIINLIYFIIFEKTKFLLSSIYYIFIFISIILFCSLSKSDEEFLPNVSKIFKFNLLLQLFIFIFGFGKNYDVTRYMGTFNDPNQFAYYVFISFCFIFIIDVIKSKSKSNFIPFLIALFLILKSASTGMLLAMSIFVFFWLFNYLPYLVAYLRKKRNKIFIISCFVIMVFPLFLLIMNDDFGNSILRKNSVIFNRVVDKIKRTNVDNSSKNSISIWEERGYDKLVLYPQYMIYGSGEGLYSRFNKASNITEIHATLPSILFYYGLVPFVILLRWFYLKLRKMPLNISFVYIALIVESFTLLNQRQTLFWIIFSIIPILKSFEVRRN